MTVSYRNVLVLARVLGGCSKVLWKEMESSLIESQHPSILCLCTPSQHAYGTAVFSQSSLCAYRSHSITATMFAAAREQVLMQKASRFSTVIQLFTLEMQLWATFFTTYI